MVPATLVRADTTALLTVQGVLTAALRGLVRFSHYCSPNGLSNLTSDTANCATQYSLTVSLVRQTVTIMPSATPLASTVNAEDLVSTPSSHASDVVSTRTPAGATKPGTTVTTSTLSQVTGGAGKTVNVGAAAVAGVVGLVGFL